MISQLSHNLNLDNNVRLSDNTLDNNFKNLFKLNNTNSITNKNEIKQSKIITLIKTIKNNPTWISDTDNKSMVFAYIQDSNEYGISHNNSIFFNSTTRGQVFAWCAIFTIVRAILPKNIEVVENFIKRNFNQQDFSFSNDTEKYLNEYISDRGGVIESYGGSTYDLRLIKIKVNECFSSQSQIHNDTLTDEQKPAYKKIQQMYKLKRLRRQFSSNPDLYKQFTTDRIGVDMFGRHIAAVGIRQNNTLVRKNNKYISRDTNYQSSYARNSVMRPIGDFHTSPGLPINTIPGFRLGLTLSRWQEAIQRSNKNGRQYQLSKSEYATSILRQFTSSTEMLLKSDEFKKLGELTLRKNSNFSLHASEISHIMISVCSHDSLSNLGDLHLEDTNRIRDNIARLHMFLSMLVSLHNNNYAEFTAMLEPVLHELSLLVYEITQITKLPLVNHKEFIRTLKDELLGTGHNVELVTDKSLKYKSNRIGIELCPAIDQFEDGEEFKSYEITNLLNYNLYFYSDTKQNRLLINTMKLYDFPHSELTGNSENDITIIKSYLDNYGLESYQLSEQSKGNLNLNKKAFSDIDVIGYPANSGMHAHTLGLLISKLILGVNNKNKDQFSFDEPNINQQYHETEDTRSHILGLRKNDKPDIHIINGSVMNVFTPYIQGNSINEYVKKQQQDEKLDKPHNVIVIDNTNADYHNLQLDENVQSLINEGKLTLIFWESGQKFGLLGTDQAQYGRVFVVTKKENLAKLDQLNAAAELDIIKLDQQIGSLLQGRLQRNQYQRFNFENGKTLRDMIPGNQDNQQVGPFLVNKKVNQALRIYQTPFMQSRNSFGFNYMTNLGRRRISAGSEQNIDIKISGLMLKKIVDHTEHYEVLSDGIIYRSISKMVNTLNDYFSEINIDNVTNMSKDEVLELMAYLSLAQIVMYQPSYNKLGIKLNQKNVITICDKLLTGLNKNEDKKEYDRLIKIHLDGSKKCFSVISDLKRCLTNNNTNIASTNNKTKVTLDSFGSFDLVKLKEIMTLSNLVGNESNTITNYFKGRIGDDISSSEQKLKLFLEIKALIINADKELISFKIEHSSVDGAKFFVFKFGQNTIKIQTEMTTKEINNIIKESQQIDYNIEQNELENNEKKIFMFNTAANFSTYSANLPLYKDLNNLTGATVYTTDSLSVSTSEHPTLESKNGTKRNKLESDSIALQGLTLTNKEISDRNTELGELQQEGDPNEPLATKLTNIIVSNSEDLSPTLQKIFEHVESMLVHFDAYVIPGSVENINEFFYKNTNGCIDEKTTDGNPDSLMHDLLSIFIYALSIKHNKPFLGICQGSQIINICNGGTLEQVAEQTRGKTVYNQVKLDEQQFSLRNGNLKQKAYHYYHHTRLSVNKNKRHLLETHPHPINARYLREIRGSNFIGIQYHPENVTIKSGKLPIISFGYLISIGK